MDDLERQAIIVIGLFIVSICIPLFFVLWLGRSREFFRGCQSPYAKGRMRLGMDVAKSLQEYVNDFLVDEPQPDNPPIDFDRAAICQETGRIFTECVSSSGQIALDWSFIQKRYSGTYISWGALPEGEKAVIRLLHRSLEGFQTEQSCPNVRPESVDREFALLSPGPLYLDRKSKILIGWKRVPGTSFEVLIVQKPIYESIDETL